MELLLAGTSSSILTALASSTPASRVLVATDDVRERTEEEQHENQVQWNRRSPIAARTLVLHALSSLSVLESVVLVYSVERSNVPFHQQSATAYEHRIDADLKGYMFLVREVLIHFSKAGAGTIDFVLHDPSDQVIDPCAAASVGAFKAMVQSLFILYQNEPFHLRGFSSESDRVDEFAEFVWATMRDRGEKATSRWNRFGGRTGLFSFGRG